MHTANAASYAGLYRLYDIVETPTVDQFSICSTHGCNTIETVSLTTEQWETVRQLFSQEAQSAEAERILIAQAIALLEQYVGKITATSNDKGGNGRGLFGHGKQMDCIDESTNSTSYLTLMDKAGLLKWHRAASTRTRGFLFFRPHSTATIEEIGTGQIWAVDSWFHDNGQRPEIIPLADWKDFWEPVGF